MAACTEHSEGAAKFACHACQRLLCSSCIVVDTRSGDVCNYCRGVRLLGAICQPYFED